MSRNRRWRRTSSVLVAAAGLLCGLAALRLVGAAPAQTVRYVDDEPGCAGRQPCYASIQQAVDDAVDGDEIRIAAGAYTETVLVVDKSLRLEGAGSGVPNRPADPLSDTILVGSPASAPGTALTVDAYEGDVASFDLSGVRMVSVATGVHLLGRRRGEDASLPPGRPESITDTVVQVARISSCVIELVPGSSSEAEPPCRGSPYGSGIVARRTTAAHVMTTTSSGGRVGICLVEGSEYELSDNRVLGASHAGVWASAVRGSVVVSGSVVADSMGPGLVLDNVSAASIVKNVLTGNAEGVRVVASDDAARATDASLEASIILGGAPELGNALGGNAGASLVLVNKSTGPESTPDVIATFNDWGTAYASVVEDLVVHRPDDPSLGLVTYMPALGVPESISLAARPARLVADGASPSEITARVLDLIGRPAAHDALTTWVGDLGTISPSGAEVEAESDQVVTTGDWQLRRGEALGPYSGTGYLVSGVAGSELSWRFDAGALLVRYGQTILDAGSFRVTIDGVPFGPYSSLGPDERWVQRVVASDLGRGPHLGRVEVVTGEVSIDHLVAGETLEAGQALTRLRAGTELGVATITGTVRGAHRPLTGRIEVPFIAGPPENIRLSFGQPFLPVGGLTTTVTALVSDRWSRSVADGTVVEFSSTLSEVVPDQQPAAGGSATTTLRSLTSVGSAVVRAAAGLATVTATIPIVAGPPNRISIETEPSTIPADSRSPANLRISVSDAWDHGVRDGTLVALTSTLGTVEPATTTVRSGSAVARLIPGSTAGQAQVLATAGSANGGATVNLVPLDASVRLAAEPQSVVVPSESVTFTLAYSNASAFNMYGLEIESPIPTGLISPTISSSGPRLEQMRERPPLAWRAARLRSGERGQITISLRVDPRQSWPARTPVRGEASVNAAGSAEASPADNVAGATVWVVPVAYHTVTVSAPSRMTVGGESATVTALVTDRFGRPARDGIGVTFSTDLGEVDPAVTTTRSGLADTRFTTGPVAGTAVVRAISVEERGDFARVRIQPGEASELELASQRDWLPVGGATTPITGTLRDRYGNPIPGARMTFDTDLGLLSALEMLTLPSGRATTTLRSGVRAGRATVLASGGVLTTSLAVDFRAGPTADVALEVRPAVVGMGQVAVAEARVTDRYRNPVAGSRVTFASSIGAVERVLVETDATGRARTAVRATRLGRGTVTAAVGDQLATAELVVIPERLFLPLATRR